MSEVAHLATAAGTPLDETDVEAMMRQYDTFDPSSTSSMQRDLAAGRPSELDEQMGAVVRIAGQYGVPVPIHDTIYRALKLRDG